MNDMRMLSMIDEIVKRESKDSNRILLSKSQELIKSEIRDTEDISFVFEQAGKQYSHIMLDEAQDTSHMQWDNLNNFLLNVISDINGRSVIVGDIKQSIYRWRNSDWQILAGLTDEKNEGVFKDRIEVNTLGFNFRSEVNIVNFNSQFFYTASKIMNFYDGRQVWRPLFCLNDASASAYRRARRSARLSTFFGRAAAFAGSATCFCNFL